MTVMQPMQDSDEKCKTEDLGSVYWDGTKKTLCKIIKQKSTKRKKSKKRTYTVGECHNATLGNGDDS